MSICFKRITGPAIALGAGLATGIFLTLFSGVAAAAYEYNLPPPVTPIGREILGLHNAIFLICVVIFVVVFGAMFYSIFAHRKSRGYKAAKFHESTTVEIVWTAIPFFILVAMAIPSTATLLRMEDTKTAADLVVKVTGHQWKWQYEYLDQDINFFSVLSTPSDQIENKSPKGEHYLLEVDKPLVIPVGKKVRFLITANDVIHSWWVPAFGVKKDAIPGFINESWTRVDEAGTYRGQCAELCGKDHGFMPIVVEVKSAADYSAWVASQKATMKKAAVADAPDKAWTLDELKARGEKVYATNCVACHQANGMGTPPAFPPLSGSKIATGPKEAHLAMVLNGKANTAMAPFKHLSDADLAAVITYERNSWANKTGDMVTPSEVTAAKGGAPAPAAAAAPAAPAVAAPATAALPAAVFFETGKAAASAESKKTLDDVVAHLKANADAKIELTGYTDKAGNIAQNMELAKQRAVGVRDALMAAGIAKERIGMKPPATVEAGGDAKQARRVDIKPGA